MKNARIANRKNPPLILLILGWFAIIAVPVAFFIFGWRDIEISCRRPAAGASPVCDIRESFAMGLYTRTDRAEGVTGIGYRTRRNNGRSGTQPVLTSTVVLETSSGEVPVSRVTSNVDSDNKSDQIRSMRAYLDEPGTYEFRHHAKMHSIFGYLGLLGVAGLGFILGSVIWHYLKRLRCSD